MWALSGSLIGVVLWSALAAVTWQFYYPPESVRDALVSLPWAFVGAAIWALVIAAVAAPCYAIVFAMWQVCLRRRPELDATARRQAVAALVLGAPPALMLTWGFSTSVGFPFNWLEAARVFPLAIVSCWGAVWLPRRIIPTLRGQLLPRAV